MAAKLLTHLIAESANRSPDAEALIYKDQRLSYAQLATRLQLVATGLQQAGFVQGDRLAVCLPKCFENVLACFATNLASGIFVPVNPILKPRQIEHILNDCTVRILVIKSSRLNSLTEILKNCSNLSIVITVDGHASDETKSALKNIRFIDWAELEETTGQLSNLDTSESDFASILYTSGSTGHPRGVLLSHKNMVYGAVSVASYLQNDATDKILALLPFSFDYGFNQLTTAFHVGASVVLMDYLLPYDVIRTIADERITGLAAVPSLWIQLTRLAWPEEACQSLRYFTNSGGALPKSTLQSLRDTLPNAKPYLMYGLTEAFRSTYLPPEQINQRPDSIGKAIPNAEILVVREDGSPCQPGEAGELIHCGPLVAQGYWDKPDKTAERFRPVPTPETTDSPEIGVWSGDLVKADEDGYLYFISRKDEMIKTSGYRVSPTEVEEVIYASNYVNEVACVGVPHPELGQAIIAVIIETEPGTLDLDQLYIHCRTQLPPYMVPSRFIIYNNLPYGPNNKIDRKILSSSLRNYFTTQEK